MEEIVLESKKLSDNKFVAFFQKIGRACSMKWTQFSDKHPKASSLLYKVAMFWIFSMMVTVFQYVVMTFLPYAFGLKLAAKEFAWPNVSIQIGSFAPFTFNIFGYAVTTNDVGEVIVGGGLGFFIAFELATFFAQVINFPLQRNITYKSHGNPYYQAMWYFIAWVLISIFCNAINSMWIGLASQFLPDFVYNILTTVITGGVSMVIFFFVFLIIFPDLNKAAEKANKKVELLKSKKSSEEALVKAMEEAEKANYAAKLSNAEKAYNTAVKLAESKILAYESSKKYAESEDESLKNLIEVRYNEAVEAVKDREAKKAEFETVKNEKR